MPDGSPPPLVSRPTVEIGGERRGALEAQLLAIDVAEDSDGLKHAELRFGAWGATESGGVGLVNLDRRVLEFGAAIRVLAGDDVLFEGRIGAIEADFAEAGPPTVTILAEDRLQDLRMTRRTRVFERSSDADIARRISAEHGLAAEIDWPGPTHAVVAQLNRSDLALLRDRARATDAELTVAGTTLFARRRRSVAAVALEQGARLRHCTLTADLAEQRSTVLATGWDVAAKQALSVGAGPSVLGAELAGSQESGAAVLERAFAARRETLPHAHPATSEEARAIAEAHFRRLARRFVVARGEAERDARIAVGATLELSGIGALFGGAYHCVAATHRYDQGRGFRTEFVAERPGLGRPA